jgi:hypothetical protein
VPNSRGDAVNPCQQTTPSELLSKISQSLLDRGGGAPWKVGPAKGAGAGTWVSP